MTPGNFCDTILETRVPSVEIGSRSDLDRVDTGVTRHVIRKAGVLVALGAALALAVAAVPASAQLQFARLEGLVLDSAGRPVSQATVALTDPLGAELRTAVTDPAGRFVLTDIAPGRYLLRAGRPGASPHDVPLDVEGAWTRTITVRLPLSFRDTLDVQASVPIESVATRASVGGDSIDALPIRNRTRGLQDLVATLPGWATEDNGLLHSRGVDDGFLYVVDGIPVYERLDQTFGLAADVATIDSLSAVTGYVPPEFGYKAGGVIELRTRSGSDAWTGSGEVGVGSDAAVESAAGAGGPLADRLAISLAAAGYRSDRYLDPVHPDNLHNTGGSARTSGRLEATPSATDRLTGGWGYGRASFDVPNTAEQEDAGQDQRQRVSNGSLTLSWQRIWSASTVSQLAAYRRSTSVALDPSLLDTPITTDADRTLTRTGALASVAHQRGRHLLKAGVEVQRLTLDERFGFAVTDDDAAEEAGLSDAAIAFDADDPFRFAARATPSLLSMYLQDSWQASSKLTLAAGLRVDRSTLILSRSQWSPRLGLAYRIDDRTTARGSISRFFQPPQPENLLLSSSAQARRLSPFADDDAPGGADVEPERQWAVEAGVTHRFPIGMRLDAAWWRRAIDEAADPNVFFGSTIIFPNAVAEGRAQGLDVRLEWLRRGPWSGYANWSLAKVTQTGPITGGLFLEEEVIEIGPGTEFTPDHDQRLTASGGVTWTGARDLTISVIGRFESGTPIERDDDDELDELRERPGAELVDFEVGRVKPRVVVSAMASVRLWQGPSVAVNLRGAVHNLFDRQYAYNFGNPFSGTHFGAPRTVTVQLRIERR